MRKKIKKEPEYSPDYIIVPHQVISHQSLKPSDERVYGIIYWYANMVSKKCIASNESIAFHGRLKEVTVEKALNRLEEAGYIKRLYTDETKKSRMEIIPLISFGVRKIDHTTVVSKKDVHTTGGSSSYHSMDTDHTVVGHISNSNNKKNEEAKILTDPSQDVVKTKGKMKPGDYFHEAPEFNRLVAEAAERILVKAYGEEIREHPQYKFKLQMMEHDIRQSPRCVWIDDFYKLRRLNTPQVFWLIQQTQRNIDCIKTEIEKAIAWCEANPEKAANQKMNWLAWMATWIKKTRVQFDTTETGAWAPEGEWDNGDGTTTIIKGNGKDRTQITLINEDYKDMMRGEYQKKAESYVPEVEDIENENT